MKLKKTNSLLFVLRRFLTVQAIFVSFLGAAHAADQTYLGTSLLDTWNTTDPNWDAGTAWVDNNNAIFAGTGETVTVSTVAASAITFDSPGYTLTGGTVTLAQGLTGVVTNSDATINSVVAGVANGIIKSGNGVLTLGGANTFNGTIDVNVGTLKLGAATGLGSGTAQLSIAAGGALDTAGFNPGSRPIYIAGPGVGGNGAIYNSSPTSITIGLVRLTGEASISTVDPGRISITTLNLDSNKLSINSGIVLATLRSISSGDIDINSGGTLYSTNGGTQTAVTGTITVNTGGRFDTRDSDNTAMSTTHTLALNGGILSNGGVSGNNGGGGGALLRNNLTVDATNGGTIAQTSSGFSNAMRLEGSISGTGALTLTTSGFGTGTEFRGDGSAYTGTVTATGGTIFFNPTAATQIFNGKLAGARPVTKNGSNSTTLGGDNTYTGATTVSAGTLVLTGSNTGNGTTAVNAGTLRLDYGTNNNRKISSGALTLGGGTIELSGGTGFTDSVASTTLTAGTSSSITRTSGTNLLDLKAITPNTGKVDFAQSGIAKTTNANNASGVLGPWATIGGSAFAKNDGTGLIVGITSTVDVTRFASVAQSIANSPTADVRITEGTGTAGAIGLGSATTTINSLTQSAIGGTSPGVIDPAGNTLALNYILVGSGAGSLTIGTGTNNGTLKSAGTALTFRDLAGSGITVNSAIVNGTAASSLTKYDAGTLTLSGTNTYTGGTVIQEGILRVGSTTALPGTGTVTLNNSSTLNLNGFGATIPTLGGAATSTVTDSSTGAGTTTLVLTAGAGTIPNKFVNGPNKAVALRIINDNGSFALNNASNTFSGGIILAHSSPNGTRMSLGTVTANAHGTGAITVGEAATDRAGIYFSAATQTFTNPIIANTALGTDRLGTVRTDAAGITLSGQLTANLAPFTFSTNGSGAIIATGKITGPNGLATISHGSAGAGTTSVTISNAANDYAGDTVINQVPQATKLHTLTLGIANAIPNGVGKGNVILNTSGTGVGRLNLGGFSETINGLSGNGTVDGVSGTPILTVGDNNATSTFSGILSNTAGTLSLTKIGSGTLTLSGVNTLAGTTSVNAGTLIVSGAPTSTGPQLVNGGTLVISGSPTGNSAVTLASGTLSLDYGTSDTSKIHDSSVLTLNGGTITLAGATGTHTEAVGSTTLGGSSVLTRSGANTAKIALGAITRNTGGSLDVAATGLATTTTVNNANGILPGVTLAGGLAMNDGSGNIVAYGSFTDVTRLGGSILNASASHVRIINAGTSGNITLGGSGTNTIASLTNTSTDGLATIDIATGRILRLAAEGNLIQPPTSTGLTISGAGTLTAGGADNTAGDILVLNQSATDTAISTLITNNGSGAVSLTKYGSGSLSISGVNTYSGGTRLNEGSILARVNVSQNALGTGAVTVGSGTTLALNNVNTSGTTAVVNNIFSGSGTLQIRFASGATARNTNFSATPFANFTGTLRLSLATGAVSTADKLSNLTGTIPAALLIDPGTQLTTVGSQTLTFTGGTTVSGTGNSETRGAIRLVGALAGSVTLVGDTTIGSEGGSITGNVTSGVAGTQTLTFGTAASNGAATVSGSIGGGTGTIALTKTSTGTVTLSGANTFTGNIVINDGVLLASNLGALGGATQITVVNGDSSGSNTNTLQLGGGGIYGTGTTTTLHNSATSGTLGNARVAIENQAGNNTWAGNIVLRGGVNQTLVNNTAITTLTINGSITQHPTEPSTGIFIRGANNGVINGNISLGTAQVSKTEGGTWTINSSGNTWGPTLISIGTIRTGAINALPATSTVTLGQSDLAATLDLNGFSQTVAGLAYVGTGTNKTVTSSTAATLTVAAPGFPTFPGVISGLISLTKSDVGTLTLSGINTYVGNTVVSAGTLALADNARLRFVIGSTSGINNSISGAGTVTLAGDFAIDTSAAFALTSGTWVLENVTSLTGPYGSTFQVLNTDGTPWTDAGSNKWTRTDVGGKTWTFDETTGTLTLSSGGYDTWSSAIANVNDRDRTDDPDGDGFSNLHEYLFGSSPIAGNGSLVTTTVSGSNLTLRWLQLETGATYTLKHSTTLDTGSWSTVVSPVPALDANQTGAPTSYDYYTVTIPFGAGKDFYRIEGAEN